MAMSAIIVIAWAMSAKRELRDHYFEERCISVTMQDATAADNTVIQRDLNGLNSLDMFYSTLL